MVLSFPGDVSSPCPPVSQGSMVLVGMAWEAEVRHAVQPVLVFSDSPEKLVLPSPSASSLLSHLPAWLLQGLLGCNYCSSKGLVGRICLVIPSRCSFQTSPSIPANRHEQKLFW